MVLVDTYLNVLFYFSIDMGSAVGLMTGTNTVA